ncbi:YbjN domain-containing protein [Phenylobacterium sp.]|uniref:YbjN domain-containing protein n=1 Tax=Phenylobacterium sp. TaxID=1871053 RepID=UPI00273241D0|nr:YbjN domain-containing protein [Phenylobacterium sp.]MDP3658865.1 YbjN domain-containing protein [Phenylobacterium sp.]
MLKRLPLLIAALALAAASPTPDKPAPAKPQPAKAAPAAKPAGPKAVADKPAAPKPAAPKPAASGPFDARDPASLVALLATMDAKGEVSRTGDNDVAVKVTAANFSFGVQYVDCNAQGKACQAMAFSTGAEKRGATLVQLNAFNQTSISCRAFQDAAGRPHVMYAAILSSHDVRDEMRTHIGVWQGCLSTFGAFLSDPAAYLASAP